MKKKLLSLILIATILIGLTPIVASASGYTYQRIVSLCQNSKCPANQTNYTVLVCANSTLGNTNACPTVSGLNQSGAGAHVQNSNGYDIVFSTTACASPTLMNWEMERYTASSGEMLAWVLIPSLVSTGNTIYMCYGNSGISSFQGGATGTAWNSNYVGVWHMPNGTSLTTNDSTSHGYNAVNHGGSAVAGLIDGGVGLVSASSQWVDVASETLFNSANVTFSAWFKTSTTGQLQDILRRDDGGGNRSFLLRVNSNNTVTVFVIFGGNGGVTTAGTYADGNWHLATVTFSFSSPNTTITLYVDGVSQGSASVSAANPSITQPLDIGRFDGGGEYFNGSMDEAEYVSTNFSANWITTEYNNQSAPGTFESFGSETSTSIFTMMFAFFMGL